MCIIFYAFSWWCDQDSWLSLYIAAIVFFQSFTYAKGWHNYMLCSSRYDFEIEGLQSHSHSYTYWLCSLILHMGCYCTEMFSTVALGSICIRNSDNTPGYRFIESACHIMKRFPSAVIINTGPGCHGPVIIDLPVQGSHASTAVTSPVLHTWFDCYRLKYLCYV